MPRIKLEISNRIAKLALCRPEKLNAIDQAMLREFEEALRRVRESANTAVLVTQGDGRTFSAGSDLKELANCSPQQAAEFEYAHGRIFAQLETLPQITVAAWQGHVLGGGLFLGIYHDFRLAAQEANIGLPEVAHGWNPPWGISRLVELIGWQAAKRLILCGGQFDGTKAQQLGLADEVWSDDVFEAKLWEWVANIAARPITALRETKLLLHQMRHLDHNRWERMSVDAFQRCYATDEAQRAVQQFVQRKHKK
ncbi:enoyl-CoA hydratase/isomerase family protein [Candidatus Poribacteria bacterium]|nr:enoyl-CoA hydratase/isomerase family protein [Candidatus Poribacteria bacterium]